MQSRYQLIKIVPIPRPLEDLMTQSYIEAIRDESKLANSAHDLRDTLQAINLLLNSPQTDNVIAAQNICAAALMRLREL